VSSSQSAKPFQTIAVVGAGAWGTALAVTAAQAGRQVVLYAREPEVVQAIQTTRENTPFLPGIRLPEQITPTGQLSDCACAEAILLVVPAQHVRATLSQLRGIVAKGTPILICAKGIEQKTGKLLTEVIAEAFPETEAGLLSGPSFARDVVRGLPTAVTIAARAPVAERLQASLGHSMFRPYTSTDLVGVALGGAAKNVYAIACGMVEGRGLGESARAALLARSFAELQRLGGALGAQPETLAGLSGLGDLTLTAMSKSSRNYSLGFALGEGKTLAQVLGNGRPLAEGAYTAAPLVERAAREGVEVPVAEAVADVLNGKLSLDNVVDRLMARPLRTES
jgi:glycerol-3-phosphate dehydrogenase (NAD(P)+)